MSLRLNELEYLESPGLNVMLAHDFYPEGHQGGVGIIQNGLRVATNGDVRLEPTPGQWSPIPKVGKREIDAETGEVSVRMEYPDESRNRKGFNPIDYPDLHFGYRLRILPDGAAFRIVVVLESAAPLEWRDRVGFNLELFPGFLFGKTFMLGGSTGHFPRQANGPAGVPLAKGTKLVVAPEDERQRMAIEVLRGGEIELVDGRIGHNNGWFVARSLLGDTGLEWKVTPYAIPGWKSDPVIQVSQVGYHSRQQKMAVIELDRTDERQYPVELLRVEAGGPKKLFERSAQDWGRFLRYRYLRLDFSDVREPGMYILRYGLWETSPFKIGDDVFERHVWQPTVDTFLPVQMCHMRVVENYRVWHGACHLDDARMAPTDHNHFDGYHQGSSTLCGYEPGQTVPGLDVGGWHDAGDYDIRVESQSQTIHGLALAYERFGLDYDNTTIDQEKRLVELMKPDGKPDVLQQVEHGALAIVAGYKALGRLYRGIIEPTLEQYVHLGDAATQTDNIPSHDDRWVFTEENPRRELEVAAALAASSRVLRGYNDPLSEDCLRIAEALYVKVQIDERLPRLGVAIELLQTTGGECYREFILGCTDEIAAHPDRAGWMAARSLALVDDPDYHRSVRSTLAAYRRQVDEQASRTPYGVPYEPHIWGAGWGIQRFGMQQYWLHEGCPDLFPIDYMLHALSFVLGCHPGPNPVSFVSGVGARSMIPGYGVNRAEFSYIPGGVGSGTALIRPDYPELLDWPYLWQQTEYCLGHATSDYVFLVAAAEHLLRR